MVNLLRPSVGRVTQPFSSSHRAIDFGWGNGRIVRAAAGGEISYDVDPYYGRRLTIWHSPTDATRYCHLASATVKTGRVDPGQEIALMGNTGSYAVFVHLHFEHWHDGVRVQPVFTTTAGTPGTPISAGDTMPQLIKQTVKGVPTYYRVDVDDVVIKIDAAKANAYNKVNGYDSAIEVSDEGLKGFRDQAAYVADTRAKATAAKVVSAPIDYDLLATKIAAKIPPAQFPTSGTITLS